MVCVCDGGLDWFWSNHSIHPSPLSLFWLCNWQTTGLSSYSLSSSKVTGGPLWSEFDVYNYYFVSGATFLTLCQKEVSKIMTHYSSISPKACTRTSLYCRPLLCSEGPQDTQKTMKSGSFIYRYSARCCMLLLMSTMRSFRRTAVLKMKRSVLRRARMARRSITHLFLIFG